MARCLRTSRMSICSSAWPSCIGVTSSAERRGAMFIDFFLKLRAAGVPVSLREFLLLQEAMQAGLADYDIEHFYFLSRAALVKDERHLDRFDQVFGQCFKGLEAPPGAEGPNPVGNINLPEEWLRKLAEKNLTDEEKALVE